VEPTTSPKPRVRRRIRVLVLVVAILASSIEVAPVVRLVASANAA
jgi:hypothetical protein